jgi:hypothetical protein
MYKLLLNCLISSLPGVIIKLEPPSYIYPIPCMLGMWFGKGHNMIPTVFPCNKTLDALREGRNYQGANI